MIYAFFIALCGVAFAAIPITSNFALVSSFTAIYGFFLSANFSLVSVILVEFITLDSFTQAYGMLLLLQGVASLIGPPIAGMCVDFKFAFLKCLSPFSYANRIPLRCVWNLYASLLPNRHLCIDLGTACYLGGQSTELFPLVIPPLTQRLIRIVGLQTTGLHQGRRLRTERVQQAKR